MRRLSQHFRRDSSGLNKSGGSGRGPPDLYVATGGYGARSKRTKTGYVDEGGEGVTEDAQASASGAGLGQCHSRG